MDELRYHVLKDGEPVAVEMLEWAAWLENPDNKRVARTEVGDVQVSTVFLGFNHAFRTGQPALWFETMIFGGIHDEYQVRYTTLDEARRGHDRAVALVTPAASA